MRTLCRTFAIERKQIYFTKDLSHAAGKNDPQAKPCAVAWQRHVPLGKDTKQPQDST